MERNTPHGDADERGINPPPPPDVEELIASVVDGLRTPLTAIKGWNQLARRRLKDGANPEDVDNLLARTSQAVIDMQRVIDLVAAQGRRRTMHLSSSPAPNIQPAAGARREDVRSMTSHAEKARS